MTVSPLRILRSSFMALALAPALALVPQFAKATPVGAQATTSNVTVCGAVSAFTAATSGTAGSITMGAGGPTFAIAPGTVLGSAVSIGANVCLVAVTNSTGQLTSAFAFPNSTSKPGMLTICGFITSSGTSNLSIGGASFTFAPAGATFTGVSLTTPGPLCINLTLNSAGQVVSGVASTTFSAAPPVVCGATPLFQAATATAPGSITINGNTLVIAAGTSFTGTPITQGGSTCLTFILGPGGQIISGRASVPLAATPYYGSYRHHGAGGPVFSDGISA